MSPRGASERYRRHRRSCGRTAVDDFICNRTTFVYTPRSRNLARAPRMRTRVRAGGGGRRGSRGQRRLARGASKVSRPGGDPGSMARRPTERPVARRRDTPGELPLRRRRVYLPPSRLSAEARDDDDRDAFRPRARARGLTDRRNRHQGLSPTGSPAHAPTIRPRATAGRPRPHRRGRAGRNGFRPGAGDHLPPHTGRGPVRIVRGVARRRPYAVECFGTDVAQF